MVDYIQARLLGFKGVPASPVAGSPEEHVLVKSATGKTVTVAGIVDVPRALLAAAQVAADLAWLAYLRSLPIGGLVVLAELEQAVLDAGAANIASATLNGLVANLQLATLEVAVAAPGTSLASSLVWRPL